MRNPQVARHIQELLAKNIKEARKKLGISQMELAKRADISAGHMNDIEACRRWVSAPTLATLARELRLKPYQLLLEESDESFDKYDLLTELLSRLRRVVDSEIKQVVMGYLLERKWKRGSGSTGKRRSRE
ncbi:MAG: helix-turn-helix transcriptional regulator [Spirochaetia bacterium]|jgi:transcriptional regulator with XRE-family HTH domain